jgi:hypothetical protein
MRPCSTTPAPVGNVCGAGFRTITARLWRRPELMVRRWLRGPGGNAGVVFLFDEVQFLSSAGLEALIAALHKVVQRRLPVTLVRAGLPRFPGSPVRHGRAKMPASLSGQQPIRNREASVGDRPLAWQWQQQRSAM